MRAFPPFFPPAEQWLKGLDLAPKSKGHLKNQVRIVFNYAMRWELLPYQANPMGFVRVKDVSKRVRQPTVLTIDQFRRVFEHIPEPYRTMCVVAGCLGLRISEVLGLQWRDFDWETRQVQIRRSWVAHVITKKVLESCTTRVSKATPIYLRNSFSRNVHT